MLHLPYLKCLPITPEDTHITPGSPATPAHQHQSTSLSGPQFLSFVHIPLLSNDSSKLIFFFFRVPSKPLAEDVKLGFPDNLQSINFLEFMCRMLNASMKGNHLWLFKSFSQDPEKSLLLCFLMALMALSSCRCSSGSNSLRTLR